MTIDCGSRGVLVTPATTSSQTSLMIWKCWFSKTLWMWQLRYQSWQNKDKVLQVIYFLTRCGWFLSTLISPVLISIKIGYGVSTIRLESMTSFDDKKQRGDNGPYIPEKVTSPKTWKSVFHKSVFILNNNNSNNNNNKTTFQNPLIVQLPEKVIIIRRPLKEQRTVRHWCTRTVWRLLVKCWKRIWNV